MKKAEKININDKIGPDKHYKIEAFRKDVRVTKPHKHNQYFEIIYLSAGSGFHWIDEVKYEVKPPVFFFLNRDQIHHWELSDEPGGFVIILKGSFLEQSKDDVLKQLLQRVWFYDCLYVIASHRYEQLLSLLVQKTAIQNSYTVHIVDGLLKALLGEISGVGGKERILQKGVQLQLYSRYLDLILTNAPLQRRVRFYAAKLKTSPQNLNTACRRAIGASASELLNRQILNEAKRLLIYTANNITEIAYQLNFKDPSYFIKFFKKGLQQTPDDYRKQGFQNHHL
ncbi:MAG: helix-turn-helix transcriptional regulator [Chitinophagaceae bacterium]